MEVVWNWTWALDGCHVDVYVSVADQGRYMNRKKQITTNMICVDDWNMKFLYVLPRWKAWASDSQVLQHAMSCQDGIVIPKGTALSLGI